MTRKQSACIVPALVTAGLIVSRDSVSAPEASVTAPEASVTVVAAANADSAFEALVSRIKTDEGFANRPYPDGPPGAWSIGYGFNSSGPFTPEQKARWLTDGITKAEADTVVRTTLRKLPGAIGNRWPPFRNEPLGVQMGLVEAAYQLGVSGLLGFHETLTAIAAGNVTAALAGIRNSLWHQKTPKRAERLVKVVWDTCFSSFMVPAP